MLNASRVTVADRALDDGAAPSSPWPVFWVASVAVFLVSLDSTMLFAAFRALRTAFPDVSTADLSWVLNAYTVLYAAMLIPSGGLADTYGRKRVFLFGWRMSAANTAATEDLRAGREPAASRP